MPRLLLVIIAVWTILIQSAFAQGLSARSENFHLVSDVPVNAASLLSDLETLQHVVIEDLGLSEPDYPSPLNLTLVNDPDTFRAITPNVIVAAIYLQSAAGHDIVIAHGGETSDALDSDSLRLMLRHELVHHLLETRYPRKIPVWLNEGLAEYYATYRPGADGQPTFDMVQPGQEPLAADQSWLPMRTVIENLSKYPDFRADSNVPAARAQRLYYGQSWALAQFVMDQPNGLARVHAFVDGWSPARDSEDSFEAAFGLRYGSLEAQIREMRERSGMMSVTDEPVTVSTAVSIAPVTAQLLAENRLRLLLTHGRNTSLTTSRIETLQDELGNRSGSLSTHLAQALRDWRVGDWEASDKALDRALDLSPGHPVALKLRAKTAYGRVSAFQSDPDLWEAAEIATSQALASRPNDADLHLFHVAVTLPVTDRLPRRARASLDWLTARDTHLRLPHKAMMMIPALMFERHFDQADAVLDSATRWQEQASDRRVIEGLRDKVAAERAIASAD